MLEHGMPIFLTFLIDKTPLTFMVKPSTKIQDFKALIELKEVLEVRLQRLMYRGEQLEYEKSFADCNIPKEFSIELTVKVLGGPDCSNDRRAPLRKKNKYI